MKSIRFTVKSIPFAFALTTILAYGLLLPYTGFYWDDWSFAWIAKFLGPREFIPAFSGFRPFLGPIFFLTTSLIPSNPLLWQIFALVIRFIAALSAWFALHQIWPNQRRLTVIISFLFLVFPGYSQQWVALTHINQEWIPFIFYLLSFGFSARAIRTPQKFFPGTIIALLFLIMGLFPTEYFIGLEPLRFLFMWVILGEETKTFLPAFIQALKRWWPYFLIWFLNAGWLAYYYKSGAYISYGVTTARQIPSIADALFVFGDALWKAGFYVWAQVFVLTSKSIAAPTSLLAFAVILLSLLLLSFYLFKLQFPEKSTHTFALQAIAIGVIGILLGRVPSFAAGLPLTLQSSFDRFMISMMFGASLFIAGLVELLIKNARAKNYIFAFLIALGIGQQFFNANIFRRDWARQQEIYWQLAWRIPALKPKTAILTTYVPIDYETDLSFTAPLNWMYAPGFQKSDLPYAMLYSVERLGGATLPDLKADTAIQLPYRTVTFRGNTSQAIFIYFPKNGCLRVLDPAFDDAETYSTFPDEVSASIPISNPSQIITEAPPLKLSNPPFSKEPLRTWCYFYEQAELARQAGNWKQAADLGREAAKQNLVASDAFENLPFIEAYARTGDLKSAQQITDQAWKDEPKIHRGLCALWKRVQADGPDEARSFSSGLLNALGCAR
ncbi:MAG: hypothetical protein HYR70_02000 [Chloroflexi bacterium]|nr:hypothetical protein [Chloroflexota bacterium]MBI3341036.1 hypothetical protein [Chloroflexota bacterium]